MIWKSSSKLKNFFSSGRLFFRVKRHVNTPLTKPPLVLVSPSFGWKQNHFVISIHTVYGQSYIYHFMPIDPPKKVKYFIKLSLLSCSRVIQVRGQIRKLVVWVLKKPSPIRHIAITNCPSRFAFSHLPKPLFSMWATFCPHFMMASRQSKTIGKCAWTLVQRWLRYSVL